MFKIMTKEKLCPVVDFFKIEAPAIAKKAKAGQFVVVRVDEVGERIPLTLADWDDKEGTVRHQKGRRDIRTRAQKQRRIRRHKT